LYCGDAPWPPQYKKMPGEPTRVQPSRARPRQGSGAAGSTGRRVSKHPLIVIAHSTKKEEVEELLEKWKAENPSVVQHLQPADILTDSMRGRSSTWWRIRINLQHVPEERRPTQPELPPIPNPWSDATPEQIAAYREMHRKRRQARKPE
jgi:bifunctional non-homologous end joining protein LigD